MGVANNINLRDDSGTPDGHLLEMRRMLDGALIIRICAPGQRAGIGVAGKTTIAEIASSLATSVELRIHTRIGYYSFLREHAWVKLIYCSFDGAWDRAWRIGMTDMLSALSDFTRRAA